MIGDFSNRFSREPVAAVTIRATRYFISQVREWTDRVGVNKETVSDVKKNTKEKKFPSLRGWFSHARKIGKTYPKDGSPSRT